MDDIKNEAPYCTAAPPDGRASDCGTSAGGSAFFVTFIILNSYLLTNLFVAAIMEFVVSGLLRQGAIVTTLDLETFQVQLLGLFLAGVKLHSLWLSLWLSLGTATKVHGLKIIKS